MPLAASYLRGQVGSRISGGISAGTPSDLALCPALMYRKWVNPITATTTTFFTTTVVPSAAITTFTYVRVGLSGILFQGARTDGTQDQPRNVVITITHGSAVVGTPSGVITGIDEFNRPLVEAWSVTNGGTTKTFTGAKSFKRVDTVTLTVLADASTDSIAIGNGNVFGLPARSVFGAVNAAVKEFLDGAILVTGTLVAGSTAAATDLQGTYLPATAPNGAHTYEVVFVVTDPQI